MHCERHFCMIIVIWNYVSIPIPCEVYVIIDVYYFYLVADYRHHSTWICVQASEKHAILTSFTVCIHQYALETPFTQWLSYSYFILYNRSLCFTLNSNSRCCWQRSNLSIYAGLKMTKLLIIWGKYHIDTLASIRWTQAKSTANPCKYLLGILYLFVIAGRLLKFTSYTWIEYQWDIYCNASVSSSPAGDSYEQIIYRKHLRVSQFNSFIVE